MLHTVEGVPHVLAVHATTDPVVVAVKPYVEPRGTLAVAEWLAVREARPLHVVSVHAAMDTESPVARSYYDRQRERIAAALLDSLQHAGFGGLQVRVEVMEGAPDEMVDRIMRTRHAALLVVGTGLPADARPGEIAHRMLRMARVPVLLVPALARARPLRRAVAAVDFSAASVHAAGHVMSLLAEDGCLDLCHVRAPSFDRDGATELQRAAYAAQCDEAFGRLVHTLAIPAGLTVTTTLLQGDAVTCLISHARETATDVVTCGRRGSGPAGEAVLGRVSDALVRQACVPVLVTPAA